MFRLTSAVIYLTTKWKWGHNSITFMLFFVQWQELLVPIVVAQQGLPAS